MDTRVINLLLTLSILTVVCGYRAVSIEEFPFYVSIQSVDSVNAHFCGGTIIAPKWILTASDCLFGKQPVTIAYGGSVLDQPIGRIMGKQLFFFDPSLKTNSFVLIQLDSDIPFSEKVKKARIPKKNAQLLTDNVKLTTWKPMSVSNHNARLTVTDKYKILFKNCKTPMDVIVPLEPNEFCGFEEDYPDYVTAMDLGTTVSKDGIVIGLMHKHQDQTKLEPSIFLMTSTFEDWIKQTLGADEKQVQWVDEVPKDSADAPRVTSILLLTLGIIFSKLI